MIAMTNAEKQKAYRDRIEAKKIAEELFGGQEFTTIETFLENVEFDESVFIDELKGAGEETEETTEEKKAVYQEAYDETYKEAFDEACAAAVEAGDFDPEEDSTEAYEDEADEAAKEAADDAIKEWEASTEDYDTTCLEYRLIDLIAAYKEAQTI